MEWTTYVVVALVIAQADALLAYALKRKFRLIPGLIAAAAWPVVVPVVILGSAFLTRNFPPTSVPLEPPHE